MNKGWGEESSLRSLNCLIKFIPLRGAIPEEKNHNPGFHCMREGKQSEFLISEPLVITVENGERE